MTNLQTYLEEIRNRLDVVLAQADPNNLHISEDTRIFIKDEICCLCSETIKGVLERVVEMIEKKKDERLANAEGLMDDETRVLKWNAICRNQLIDELLAKIKELLK